MLTEQSQRRPEAGDEVMMMEKGAEFIACFNAQTSSEEHITPSSVKTKLLHNSIP